MYVQLRSGPGRFELRFRLMGLAAASAAAALAGCSASITRFDNPSFALGEGASGAAAKRPAVADATARPAPAQNNSYGSAPVRRSGVEVAGLQPIEERAPAAAPVAPPQGQPARAMAVTRQPTPAPAPAAAVPIKTAEVAKGQQIEVQQGDTLYGIAKRHKVMISDLMAANELRNPNIKPGQKLIVPASGETRAVPKVKPERTAVLKPQTPEPASVVAAPVVAAEDAGGTYVVKPGDSLYSIAARHKLKVLDLQRANDITDAGKVKPGTVLKLPSAHSSGQGEARIAGGAAQAATAGETVQPDTRIVRVGAPGAIASSGVKVLNGGDGGNAAAPAPVTAEAPVVAAAPNQRLRWPAKGRVIQGFGPRPDGTHNDGVDIAVPAGTDVLAAEDGVVAYAGNEVKTYGNLVLVRHDNGWVTAYAFNERLLVQRGDRVKRGQPVAKAGRSGASEQPHVHFEVRVGSRPVDPTGYLEKL